MKSTKEKNTVEKTSGTATRKQQQCNHEYQKTLLGDYQCSFCNLIIDKI